MRATGLLALILLSVIVILPALPGRAESTILNPDRNYISCPARNGDILTGLVRDAVSGRTVGVLLYRVGEERVDFLRNDLPRQMRVLHAYPLRNGEVLVAALDTANGTIEVLSASPSRGDGILEASTRIYTVSVRGGFIRSAYAQLGNMSLHAAVSALIFHGGEGEDHILLLKADLARGEASAMGLPAGSLVMNITGFEPCSPSLVSVENESFDFAPLLGAPATSRVYHVLLPANLRPDPYSMIVWSSAEGDLIVAHPAREANRILVIDLSAVQARADVYISPPLAGIASFEPKAVVKTNHSVYTVYATALTSRGTQEGLIVEVALGSSPRIEAYPIAGMVPAPLDPSTALLVSPDGRARAVSLENITLYSATPILEDLAGATLGLAIAPLRLSSKYNVTIEKAAIQGAEAGGTTTRVTGTALNTREKPSPAPSPAGGEGGRKHSKIMILALLLVFAIAIAAAAAIVMRLISSRRRESVMGEPVIRY